jgi:hypothetical protein
MSLMLSLYYIDIGVTTSSPLLSRVHFAPLALLGFRKGLNLARAKSLQIEAPIISIGSTHVEPKVINACLTRLDTDVMP